MNFTNISVDPSETDKYTYGFLLLILLITEFDIYIYIYHTEVSKIVWPPI